VTGLKRGFAWNRFERQILPERVGPAQPKSLWSPAPKGVKLRRTNRALHGRVPSPHSGPAPRTAAAASPDEALRCPAGN